MHKYLYTAAIAMAFSVAVPAHAQMVTAQKPESIISALQGAGYKATLEKDDSGDPMITSSSGGSNFTIFFYGCTKNVDCATIQFFAGYKNTKATVADMNAWNAKQRFSRAYIADTGNPRVEMDLDLDDGGLSTKLFEDNLEFWVVVMGKFEKHIGV